MNRMMALGCAQARCPSCNAYIGTMGGDTPPHLPDCPWFAEQMRLMQNHVPTVEEMRGLANATET